MEFKKKEITEIIDGNGELIGNDDYPQNGSNLDTQAKKTTDYNAKVGTQPFRYDTMGRFGFTLLPFSEGKENKEQADLVGELSNLMFERYLETLKYYYKNPTKLKSDYRQLSKDGFKKESSSNKNVDLEWANKIVGAVESFFEKAFSESVHQIDEDKVVGKKLKTTTIGSKSKDNDISNKEVKEIAGLLSKLDKKNKKKLLNILEED
jgi:hypothetical protein